MQGINIPEESRPEESAVESLLWGKTKNTIININYPYN